MIRPHTNGRIDDPAWIDYTPTDRPMLGSLGSLGYPDGPTIVARILIPAPPAGWQAHDIYRAASAAASPRPAGFGRVS